MMPVLKLFKVWKCYSSGSIMRVLMAPTKKEGTRHLYFRRTSRLETVILYPPHNVKLGESSCNNKLMYVAHVRQGQILALVLESGIWFNKKRFWGKRVHSIPQSVKSNLCICSTLGIIMNHVQQDPIDCRDLSLRTRRKWHAVKSKPNPTYPKLWYQACT